jgi:NIPSNAP/Domain of unknown function (DUF4437)
MIRAGMASRHAAAMIALLAGIFALSHSQCVPADTGARKAPIHRLRIYEIFERNKQAFHARFEEHAVRIMAKHDFKIIATWETRKTDRTEFVYLLEWPDEQTMTDRWSRFMADQEWSEIKKRTAAVHGQLVGNIESRILQPTDYSPDVHHRPEQPPVVAAAQAKYAPVNPAHPQGARLAVLSGDPQTGPSSMLLKFGRTDGAMHVHSSDYHLVVIEGTMQHWSAGESQADAPLLGPGSFWFQRGEQAHQDACRSDQCVMYVQWAGKRDARLAPAQP